MSGDYSLAPAVRYGVLILLWLVFYLGMALTSVAADVSRFQRLAERLELDVAGKQQFADIALLELAEVLLAEAALARRQAVEDRPDSRDLLGWAVSVEGHAGDVLRLQRAVQASEGVQLLVYPLADLTIKAGLQSAMITHPRGKQQPVLEASIVAAFCARNDCARLLSVAPTQVDEPGQAYGSKQTGLPTQTDGRAGAGEPEPIPVTAESRTPAWSFTRDGNVCEQRGLRVEFPPPAGRTGHGLTDERALCRQLFAEANNLALELRWQARQGVTLEWSAMVSTSLPQRADHAVMLNSAGDTLLIALPLMHGTQGLLNVLLPWLAAEVAGGPTVEITLLAADLGWTGAAE